MSKGLIVVDVPENCKKCEYRLTNGYCIPSRKDIFKFALSDQKPDWCPIRLMPQKGDEDYFPDELQTGMAIGWNGCIDETLKEGSR